MSELSPDSIELMVTSPPYPMIEMWDSTFASMNDAISRALSSGDGEEAFRLMHDELERVWKEISRIIVDGGIVCINVGDATRTIDGRFRLYPNHAEIIRRMEALGFQSLPTIHWRKPTNKKTKFMGSGMIPPNAYPTLEHENILVFRNGGCRSFPAKSERRYESAYFWEERNKWFTDTWTDVAAADQSLEGADRDSAAAYPFEIPYRLINMFSVRGDTVLDPFLGTGTTSVAAAVAGRSSLGYEIDSSLIELSRKRMEDVPQLSTEWCEGRLESHKRFLESTAGNYDAEHYDTRVMTKQETEILLYRVSEVNRGDGELVAIHEPFEGGNG